MLAWSVRPTLPIFSNLPRTQVYRIVLTRPMSCTATWTVVRGTVLSLAAAEAEVVAPSVSASVEEAAAVHVVFSYPRRRGFWSMAYYQSVGRPISRQETKLVSSWRPT